MFNSKGIQNNSNVQNGKVWITESLSTFLLQSSTLFIAYCNKLGWNFLAKIFKTAC